MRSPLDFDDAGALDDEAAKGITIGDVRSWHDRITDLEALNLGQASRIRELTAAIVRIRGWREIGRDDRLAAITEICDDVLDDE